MAEQERHHEDTLISTLPAGRRNYLSFRLVLLCQLLLFGGVLISVSAIFLIGLQWRPLGSIWAPVSQSVSANARELNTNATLHPEDHVWRGPEVKVFSWNITSAFIRPDGVIREVIHINNQFPGPTIEVRTGDIVEVEVHNHYHEEVSIHWHGLHMRGANGMDGAVGITQCAIPSGGKFTYQYTVVDQSGTFWYHAHSETQRGDGLYGALIVHEPGTSEAMAYGYDKELLLLVGDWYHHTSAEVLGMFMNAASDGNEPCPDSLLVNGLGYFDCSRALPAFPVDCRAVQKPKMSLDKALRHRVRVVNVGSMTGISVSIPDSHINVTHLDGDQKMLSTDMANSVGILYPGERVDFIMEWPSERRRGYSEIVIRLDKEDFQTPNLALSPTQSFSISPGSPNILDHVEFTSSNIQDSKGQVVAGGLPEPEARFVIYSAIETLSRLHNIPTSFINRTTWEPQSRPLISLPRDEWDSHQLVPWTGPEPCWVELVINNMDASGHPFHLHGHGFYVVSSYRGKGGWDYYNPFDPSKEPRGGPLDTITPLRKDTVYVPAFGYVVLRFLADNRGIWLLHCHILWHQASGMTMAFQVLGDGKSGMKNTELGASAEETCRF